MAEIDSKGRCVVLTPEQIKDFVENQTCDGCPLAWTCLKLQDQVDATLCNYIDRKDVNHEGYEPTDNS